MIFSKRPCHFCEFPQFFWVPVPQIDSHGPTFFRPPNYWHHWSHQEGPEAGLQGWNVFNHTVHASGLAEHPAGWFNGFWEWDFSREFRHKMEAAVFLGAGAMCPCICNYMFCHVWFCIDTVYHMICHIKYTCIYVKINVQKDPSNQQWLEGVHQQCVEIEAYKIFFLHIARKTQNKGGGGAKSY